MLDAGKSRKEINEELELNANEQKLVWSNPKLKGKKKNANPIGIVLVDDEEDNVKTVVGNVEDIVEEVKERELVNLNDDNF